MTLKTRQLDRSAPPAGPSAWLRLLRPSDWVKNLLVFVALVFSGNLTHPPAVLLSLGAFAAFCLMASGFYALNDAWDVSADRQHPLKRHRPVASGEISRSAAFLTGTLLLLAGAGVAVSVTPLLGLVAGIYILLQLLYNLRLKRVLSVDVVVLAMGFVLRAAAGAAAIHVQISIWLVLTVFFLCLYLGFIKRLADLTSAQRDENATWNPPAGYRRPAELHWLLGISATLTLVSYLTYTLSPHAQRLFGARSLGLALLTPLIVITVHRFYRRADSGLSDRPLDAIAEDRAIQVSVLFFITGVIVTLYLPQVEQLLSRLFLH